MHWALARWGGRWSIRGIDDWASLPVLLLAVTVFGFLSEPAMNSFSRMLEHHADIYGLEVIHGIVPNSSQAAAQAFQILGRSEPGRSESQRVREVLAVRPSVDQRSRAVRFRVRPVGQGPGAEVRKVSKPPVARTLVSAASALVPTLFARPSYHGSPVESAPSSVLSAFDFVTLGAYRPAVGLARKSLTVAGNLSALATSRLACHNCASVSDPR